MRHPTTTILSTLTALSILIPTPASAASPTPPEQWTAWSTLAHGLPSADSMLEGVSLRAQISMLTGKLAEASGYPVAAARHYLHAAAIDPRLRDPLTAHAASLLLSAQDDGLPRLRALAGAGFLDAPIPGASITQLRVHAALGRGAPTPALARAAVDEDRRRGCDTLEQAVIPTTWIGAPDDAKPKLSTLTQAGDPGTIQELLVLLHARCEGPGYTSWATRTGVTPDAESRLRRAELLYAKVQFTSSLAELDLIPDGALPEAQRCRALFRRARSSYRLRKRRSESGAHFERIIDECTEPSDSLRRRRALYHQGKRAYGKGKTKVASARFSTLLAEYPDASHADDAIMYLARIARDGGKRKDHLALVNRALSEAPDGDMIHELVWEYVEPTLRAGDHQEFLDELGGFALPERDDQYFSQGRLEYFEGYARSELKDAQGAKASWMRAWKKYPFSFYGYLSRERLTALGEADALTLPRPARPDMSSTFPPSWRGTTSAALLAAGLPALAAFAETTRLREADASTDQDQWRLATLHHLAGNVSLSHNIARRRISGRPWADPEAGRTARWAVAWPNPFGPIVSQAMSDERAQHEEHDVRAALALAIMREESSFVPTVESYAGALGLMQLMPRTALDHDRDIEGEATPDRLRTPEINVRVAADHLFLLARRLDSHPVLMAAAYNAGAGACRRWLKKPRSREIGLWVEDIPYDQTRDYTKRVIGSYLAYQWLAGRDDIDAKVLSDASID